MLRVLPEPIMRIARPFLTTAGRSAARRLAWLTAWSLGVQACGLLCLLLLTAALPPAQFGRLIFALTMQSYLGILGMGGAYTIALREACQRPAETGQIAATYVRLTAVLASAVGVGGWIIAWCLQMSGAELLMLGLIAAGNVAACMTLRPLYDAEHRQPQSAAMTLAAELLALAILSGLYVAGLLTTTFVVAVYSLKWALVCAVHAICLPLHRSELSLANWQRVRVMFADSWPLMVGALLRLVPLTGGVLLLRMSKLDEQVAVLGVLQQIVLAYVLLATLANRIVEPYIAGPLGLHSSFAGKLATFTAAFLALLWCLLLSVGVIATETLLPDTYRGAWQVLGLLLLAAAADATAMIGRMYLIVLRAERLYLGAALVASSAFLLLAGRGLALDPLKSVAIASIVATTIGATLTFVAIGFLTRARRAAVT